jgi:hypothetical protein
MMHGRWKSDPLGEAAFMAAEAVEGRGRAKGNAVRSSTHQTQSWASVSHAWTAYVAPQGGIRRSG